MKIKEITENADSYKVMQSSPQGIELAAPDGTKINLPPEKAGAVQLNPQDPNKAVLNLNNPALGQPAPVAGQQAAPGQLAPVAGQQAAPGQPAQQGQQAAPGQQPATGLPPVGASVELADNNTSTIQAAEGVDDEDLIDSGKNHDIGDDPTDDFIDDVVDHDWEKAAGVGRSKRVYAKPEPVRESAELIAMLTIAGLR
jgi:hypothetical protein